MNLALTILITAAAVIALNKPIRKYPYVFYAIAILLDILLISMRFTTLPRFMLGPLNLLMQKGTLGIAMFMVVMYIGVFPRDGKISKMLRPVRGELSILACILVAGHMVFYLMSILGNIGALKANMLAGFIAGVVLLALILVLGVTSARFVKRHMKARQWKQLQRFSYLFYGLVYVHLVVLLGPAALLGKQPALANLIIYTILFVVYFIARIIRYQGDKRDKVDIVESVMSQGFIEK